MLELTIKLVSSSVTFALLSLIFALILEWFCDVGRLKGSRLLGASDGEWFPRLKGHFRYIADGYGIIHDEVDEKSDKIYQIPFAGARHYILPPRYIEELRSSPQSIANSSEGIAEYFLGNSTTLHATSALGPATWQGIRKNLTSDQKLEHLVPRMVQYCAEAMSEAFCCKAGQTTLTVRPALIDIIAKMNGPVLVGDHVYNNTMWAEISKTYSLSIFPLALGLKLFPTFMHPFIRPLFPVWWRIRSLRHEAYRVLGAEVSLHQSENAEAKIERKRDNRETMTDWLIQEVGPDCQSQEVVNRLLAMSFAATQTSAIAINGIIFALAEYYDEYGPMLVAELEEALAETSGEINMHTIKKLKKLDSFMKEVMRHSSFTAISFQRMLLKDHVLSDGTFLPKGSQIAVASGPLAHSQTAYDRPDEFRGLRFYIPPDAPVPDPPPKIESYTTSGVHSMLFGHGRWACPGRFFANVMAKVLLMHVIANYELRLIDGKLPELEKFGDLRSPIPEAKIAIRRRKPTARLAPLQKL